MANTPDEEGSWVSSFGALLESGAGADVTLVVGDTELPAHSLILVVRSPVFAATLKHDMQESRTRRIEISDVQEAVLRQLLCFMYTDTVPQIDSMAAELFSAADKYNVPLLKKRCEQAMSRQLTVENAAATAVLAELHSCPLLKSATVDFIAGHPQVMATEGWRNALHSAAEVAAEICKQVAVATPPPQNRILSEEHKKNLMERLFKAARNGSVDEMWALLDAGAPINAKDGAGNTALHIATENNHAATVKFLIGAGADVNVRDSKQSTPLHKAARVSDVHIMWMLLAASACKDAQDKEGNTPLHLAARGTLGGYEDQVKALLLAGAKRDIKNSNRAKPFNCYQKSISTLFDTNDEIIMSLLCNFYAIQLIN